MQVAPRYKTGAKRQVTAEWRQRVLERLQELGKNPAWIEHELGLSAGTMHLILYRNRSSLYVDAISELLDILPAVSEDAEVTELVWLITQLSAGNREIVRVMIRALIDFQAQNRR